jgi:fumarate reductase flavoprotein subunit
MSEFVMSEGASRDGAEGTAATAGAARMSRRSFVEAAGVAGAAAAVAGATAARTARAAESGKAGSSSDADAQGTSGASAALDASDVAETYTADIVVAGSGGCGTSAAVRAAQLGLDVVVVEQSDFTGGTSMCTEGLFAVGTHLQSEAGIDLTVEQCFSGSMDFNHWEADGGLAMELFSNSADNFDWLESLGVKFKYAIPNGDSLPTWHVYEEGDTGLPGELYLSTLTKAAQDLGVRYLMSTSAQQLVMEDGKVAGLLCTTDAGTVRVDAPVVVLATGGFANNAEMIQEYAGVDPDRVAPAGLGQRNGDGIRMGLAAGGRMNAYPGCTMFYGGQPDGAAFGTPLFAAFTASPILWINGKGKRFTSEEWAATNFSYAGNSIKGQDEVYSVINDAILEHFETDGVYNDMGQYFTQGQTLPTLRDDIADQVANNPDNAFEADTVEELAEKIGCDADTLAKTLDDYNACCEAGDDTEFGKPSQWLIPVDGGKYYAYKLKLGFFTTCGGLRVSTDSEVLDGSGDPIPGLYAGGSDAGGLYGATYDVSVCTGSQQGWAVHSGKRAAEAAVAYLGK